MTVICFKPLKAAWWLESGGDSIWWVVWVGRSPWKGYRYLPCGETVK